MQIHPENLPAWEILSTKLEGWAHGAISLFPNLVVGSLVMLAFWGLAKLFGSLAHKVLGHSSESQAVTRLIESSVRMLVLFFGLFTTLGILNLDKTVTSLLAGAGVLGLAIGFAFQEIAANFFSGILIALRKPYREGDIVQIDSTVGTVADVTLRTTNIQTFGGLLTLVPNKDMFTKAVTNYTRTPDRRVDIKVGVGYDADLENVQRTAMEAVSAVKHRLGNRETEFYYLEFAESSITFEVRFWIEFRQQRDYLEAKHEGIKAIKKAFDGEGIAIPFPIRTLDLGPLAPGLQKILSVERPASICTP